MNVDITSLIAAETSRPVHPAIAAVANHVRQRHGNVAIVIAYGSTLRDVAPEEGLIDLYVLTEDAKSISSNALSRCAALAVPPNVYYAECRHDGKTCRAKYAVMTLAQFAARTMPRTANPYIWARFAQPCRIVWSSSATTQNAVVRTLAMACQTALGNAKAIQGAATPRQQWIALFQNTYRTELRPESANRAEQVFTANQSYFEALSQHLAGTLPIKANWPARRFAGKVLSVLRLGKAAFTFQGGADYIAWKIKRHSGVDVPVSDWQRRHPLVAGITLLPWLLRKGAVK